MVEYGGNIRKLPLNFFHDEGFKYIPLTDIIKLLDTDTNHFYYGDKFKFRMDWHSTTDTDRIKMKVVIFGSDAEGIGVIYAGELKYSINSVDILDLVKRIYGPLIKISSNDFTIQGKTNKSVRYKFNTILDDYEILSLKDIEYFDDIVEDGNTFFENSLIPALVLFVPMLMDSGGNSGSQASVTAIRALSIGEVKLSDVHKVLFKEIRVGLLCGFSLGAVAFVKVLLVDRLLMNNPAITVWVALAVAITLASTVLLAKMIGASLPLLAKRIGFDPAVMASPLITTLVDAVSLIVYFLIAGNVFGLRL